jgi:hypothetical protein
MATPRLEVVVDGKVVTGKPFFKTQAEYNEWAEAFTKAVEPALREYAVARARSEEDSRHHMVD